MANQWKHMAQSAERRTVSILVRQLLKRLNKTEDTASRSEQYVKILNLAERYVGNEKNKESFDRVREIARDPENRWVRFINRIIDETDENYAHKMIMTLGYNAFLQGTRMIRRNREIYHCNIPWLILFDPTDACNMHCQGCWSGTYGRKNNLSYEDMDRIITQGKELGVYLYMLTGGEPLVRKKDILRLAEKHNDVEFGIFDNSTLIDDAFCRELLRLGNITMILSIEGTPETNDARRGEGHYAQAMKAMDLLKSYGIVFGTSICYTRNNIEAVTDDSFLQMISEKGARFGFYFHYMPVGNNAVPELMPTAEQRAAIIDKLRWVRTGDCPIEFFPMDFQNDGEFVGGCIAGGRNYFHINASGDAEPCVFIHYSDSNIHDKSILEILQSPLFRKYHEGQPFNRNHLRPCPMLENPQLLREIVAETGAHSTNAESEESAEHLCAKCDAYAAEWKPVAERIWAEETHKPKGYENYTEEKRNHPELAAFEHASDPAANDLKNS